MTTNSKVWTPINEVSIFNIKLCLCHIISQLFSNKLIQNAEIQKQTEEKQVEDKENNMNINNNKQGTLLSLLV